MSLCSDALFANAAPPDHLVQLYESDDRLLAENVARFIGDGLRSGEHAVIVTGRDTARSFERELARLGIDAAAAMRDEALVALDADETLTRILVDGYPDAERFDSVVGTMVRHLIATSRRGRARAFGDMVGVLWKTRQFPSAIRLEQLWAKLLEKVPFSLFCGYQIDIFGADFESGVVDAMLCAHTHFLPAASNAALAAAIERAMQEVLGANVTSLGPIKHESRAEWPSLPGAESMILWVKNNLREQAGDIFARARDYCQTSA